MPDLYIIAGCNGAGKTTASYTVLPEILACKEFVNADSIAAGSLPFNPESVALEAGRIMLQRIDTLMHKGVDFTLETTLATKSYVSFIKEARNHGYNITLLYWGVSSPEIAMQKIKGNDSDNGKMIVNNKASTMTNKQIERKELSEKIKLGVELARRKLVEARAAANENLIIGDKDGNVKSVPAKDLLNKIQQP